MRRPIIISLSVGAALLMVSLGLLMAQVPAATASSGSVTHTTFNDFGNSGPNCLVGSNPVLTNTFVNGVGGGAVALAGALDDDFPGSSLNESLWETDTWGANPYTLTISNSILTLPATTTTDIDGGWVRSLTSYTAITGSTIVMEAAAAFGNGNSQHIGFGASSIADFINKHILFSTYAFGDGNLYARVDNSNIGGPTIQNLGATPSGMHRYRIEWTQTTVTTDTVTFYIDNASLAAIDVAHILGAADFRAYLSNDGPADLNVDVVDVAPDYAASGTYTSCLLDAGADNAWQTVGWDATSPAGTTLTVTTRTSFDALTWSDWVTMPVSGTALSPKQRYAQYQLQLATTDALTTTLVNSVNLAFDTGLRTFAKSDGGKTQAAIGSVIPYTLTITVPQTATRNLMITDTLPAGLIYGGHTLNGISTTPTFTPSAPNDGSAPVILTWDFGAGDAVFTAPAATIVFSATVANVNGNQTGTVLTDDATMTYQNGAGNPQTPLTASDDFTVTEPAVTMSKVVLTPPSPADAGGTVAYRVIITNTAGANVGSAYDTAFTDTLPSSLALNLGSVSGSGSGGASSPVNSSAGNTVTMTVATIPAGGSVTINYSASLNDAVNPSQSIANTGTAAWTSQSGVNAGERTGSGGVNDYTAQSAASFTIADPSLGKALTATSAGHTTGSNVTIGEVITFSLPVTLPEGTTPSLVVTDSLPSGLAFVTSSVNTSGFNGTGASSPVVTTPGGNNVVFTFSGPITVAADNVTTNNAFTLTVRARVQDVVGNASGAVLSNSATLQVDGASAFSSNTVAATVVEPQLTVSKTITPSQVVTGDVVTTTITVTNTGASTAFDVTLTDPMPNNRFTGFGTISTPGGFTFSAPSSGPTTTLTYGGGTIAPTVSVTFSFTATVGGGYTLGEIFNNTATITGTSLPGVDANERSTSTNSSDSLTFGNVVIYDVFLPLIMKSGP